MAVRVTELIIYPIKGCAGTPMRIARLTPAGLAHDRSFMVTTADGGFRSQRRDPALSVVRPLISDDGTWMTLDAPGSDTVGFAVDDRSRPLPVELFGQPFTGIDQGHEVSEWLSAHLGHASRLVRVPRDHDRVSDGLTPGTSGYADSSAVLMVSRSSLAELNRRIQERGAQPVPMERFRPNIVVDGWDEPHVEDTLRRVTIADAELGFAKVSIRCAVTLVDQPTGLRAGPEPLRTLATYRRVPEGSGVAFGAKFAVLATGTLSTGDGVIAAGALARH